MEIQTLELRYVRGSEMSLVTLNITSNFKMRLDVIRFQAIRNVFDLPRARSGSLIRVCHASTVSTDHNVKSSKS